MSFIIKKINVFAILFLTVVANGLVAQYNSEFLSFDKMGRSVSINAEYELGSNGLKNDLTNKFLYGGYIDKETKENSLKSMKNMSVAGGTFNYNVSTFFGKNSKYSYLIGLKDQLIFNSSFTKDAYQLAFYGNKPYLGQTKYIGGTSANYLHFQELKIGFIWHKVDSTAKIGASVSLLKGYQLFNIRTREGSALYTNNDGTALEFTSNFNMAISDTSSRKNFFDFSGIGASADIFFETPYKGKLGLGSVLTVNANNIGFIHWTDNSVQYSSDSVLTFDGYHINNLFDLKDSTLSSINRDSVVRRLTNAHREPFNVNIPTNLLIINKIQFTEKFAFSVGFRYLFNSNFKPYIFTNSEYGFNSKITGDLHLAYGGYSRLNVGLALTFNSNNWYLKLGSNGLQGFLLPKQTYGQSLFFSVAKKIGKL